MKLFGSRRPGTGPSGVAVVVLAGAASLCLFCSGASGQPDGPRPPARPVDSEADELLQAAGLPEGTRPLVLGLEQALDLALIRHRATGPEWQRLREAIRTPEALAELGRRYEVADDGRFRADFLAQAGDDADGAAFRASTGDYLDLVVQWHAIEFQRLRLANRESVWNVVRHMAEGGPGSSNLTPVKVDAIEASVLKDRRELEARRVRYRDALDAFKACLGLPVDRPVIPDRSILDPFLAVFQDLNGWFQKPERTWKELPGIVERLPGLEDVTIAGGSVLAADSPKAMHALLSAAADLASSRRSAESAGAEELLLTIRRRIRRLHELSETYQADRRLIVLAARRVDDQISLIFAPPGPGDAPGLAGRGPADAVFMSVLESRGELNEAEHRLIATWGAYNRERAALYRDLGTLPYDSRAAFLRSFQGDPPPADPGPRR